MYIPEFHYSTNTSGILVSGDVEHFRAQKIEDFQKSNVFLTKNQLNLINKKMDCTIHIEVESSEKVEIFDEQDLVSTVDG